MSRRSKRLGTVEQDDDRISNSSVESHLLYRESPARSLRRTITTIKLPNPRKTTERSYYSETSSYISRDKGDVAASLQDTSYAGTYWGEGDLVRKRMGTDVPYNSSSSSSSKNGFSETQLTYDRSTSSSGYSSEEDNTGQYHSDDYSTQGSWWRRWTRCVRELPWLLLSYPGRLFGLLYWWFGTTWYRLTTSASLLDVFILTRHYGVLKKVLMILLLLLILSLIATGLWHFYPFGLQNLASLPVSSFFSWKQKHIADDVVTKEDPGPQTQPPFSQMELISRLDSLEKRFQGLENHQKKLKNGEKNNAVGSGPSRDQIAQIFKELSSHRDASLKESILEEGSNKAMNDLKILRAEQQGNLQEILERMRQLSKEVNGQILQLKRELKSPSQEELRGTFMLEMRRLEKGLVDLQEQVESVKNTQGKMSQEMEEVPRKIQGVKDEVELLFHEWLMVQTDPNSSSGSLSKHFLRRDELQEYLLDLEKKILSGLSANKQQWATQAHHTIERELQAGGLSGVSKEEVHDIVNRALQRYSEDRIGLVDYALESSGASVINTRCSETYETKTALLSLFGIPLWYQSQSPRVILQPDSNPGNCWAFRGSQGYAVIRLSSRIRPTAVTLDHIPRSLSPKATVSSAPKNFSIFGLDEETEKEGLLLGNFTYNQNGDPIQTFVIEGDKTSTYQLIELRIQSNWGHPEYTCIYRFRVHGETEM
ncbi:SUN domain-containing protein 2 [Pelobates fuscus]|uniref:SUN domain-containing protein 2 n=1 Tax=Pelobates fuscus TaxID=191477 RepID=UPI002FE48C52